jgi:hypothetical protein
VILRASKTQIKGDFIEVLVHGQRTKRKLLPREGWEELETGFYVLSKTRKWVKPLFLLRKRGELVAYEGRMALERASSANEGEEE